MDHRTARYQQELKHTRTVVRNRVEQLWRALPDYRSKSQADFIDQVVPVVQAGQERAVSLTAAYMSAVMGQNSPVALPYASLTGAGVRNGIDPREVYSRPFTTLYTSIALIGFSKAYEKALSRLLSTADMDVAMSARDASTAYGQADNRVQAFMRVADPNCCDFCQSIDGAKVRSEDPAPLHNNCGCTVEPLTEETLDRAGDTVSISSGSVYGVAEIHDHGEMGPYIYPKGDEFTGVSDLPADYRQELAQAEN